MDSEERWAQYWVNRYKWALETRSDLDEEDLMQAARIGIWKAKQTFDSNSGGWGNYSGYFIKNEIREALGIRNGRVPRPTISLDETIDEEGNLTRLDMLADETAPDAEEVLCRNDMRLIVTEAVERLEEQQRDAIKNYYIKGKTYKGTAEAMGIDPKQIKNLLEKGKMYLRRDRTLRAIASIERSTNYYAHVGVKLYSSTMTSAVERIVLRRETKMEMLRCI